MEEQAQERVVTARKTVLMYGEWDVRHTIAMSSERGAGYASATASE